MQFSRSLFACFFMLRSMVFLTFHATISNRFASGTRLQFDVIHFSDAAGSAAHDILVLLLFYCTVIIIICTHVCYYRFKKMTMTVLLWQMKRKSFLPKESRIPRGCTTSVKHHKVQTITTTPHSIILFLSNTINGTRPLLFGLLGP